MMAPGIIWSHDKDAKIIFPITPSRVLLQIKKWSIFCAIGNIEWSEYMYLDFIL